MKTTQNPRMPRLPLPCRLLMMLGIVVACLGSFNVAARPANTAETTAPHPNASRETTTFWVVLRRSASLSLAGTIVDWDNRGRFVVDQLKATAEISQANLRELLRRRGVAFRPFWIANVIRVTADKRLRQELQSRPEVDKILPDRHYSIPKPLNGRTHPRARSIEWNIDRIRAPEVWSTFGVLGEGIVVANIDTGVQFDHPALIRQYRGNLGGGDFDHNYNWFDPSQVCDAPSSAPCDNAGHGSHTMGTMVGDDGDPGANQIGVAPRARWIAVKGCETLKCSLEALLAAGEWILAPMDLEGKNPRADLRPHIVNNSWAGGHGDPFYRAIVDAWVASGIFPAFANGNGGPACGSSESPGDYVQSYSSGAFGIANEIADFSGRGPSPFAGELKPNIAAPGINIRSSMPNGYGTLSGTSMASPHSAGTVALMWSAAPIIKGDIPATRALLDRAAIDTPDLACGGTGVDNNVWGEGILDAFAAVDAAPRGAIGAVEGSVIDARTDAPISGATVRARGANDRTTESSASGRYRLVLPVGGYDVSVNAFGYLEHNTTVVEIRDGETILEDFALTEAPKYSLAGFVVDSNGEPLARASVSLPGTPISTVMTDAGGYFRFDAIPEAEYDVLVDAGRCTMPESQHVNLDGNAQLDFTLPRRADGFGYSCITEPADFLYADTILPLSGDDDALQVDLPFPFPFYGKSYDKAFVSTNGFLNFLGAETSFRNASLPNAQLPNAAIYAFWDDLLLDDTASIRTTILGNAPDRRFVIEWRDAAFCCVLDNRFSFEIVLFENGDVVLQYTGVDADSRETGAAATIGIEDDLGAIAFQYSFEEAAIENDIAVQLSPPSFGVVQGYLTDAVDNAAIENATVRAVQNGSQIREVSTDAEGFFTLRIPPGAYTLEVVADDYESTRIDIDVPVGETLIRDIVLRSARITLEPATLDFALSEGLIQSKTLTVINQGETELTFEIDEIPVTAAPTFGTSILQNGSNSSEAPTAYHPNFVSSRSSGGTTLVFMDALPWKSDALLHVLTANGIRFDIAKSTRMAHIDLSRYEVVFISNDQPQDFYDHFIANGSRFEAYVKEGGFLWVGAAAWGFNAGTLDRSRLPGGVQISGPVFEDVNNVLDHSHPVMQGIPDPFSGSFASHAAFENLPANTTLIAEGADSGLPTLIEYPFGAGRVLAFGQALEFGFQLGDDTGLILENGVPYADAFSPAANVPWLSAAPADGSIAPGNTHSVAVTVDAGGLEPGLYRGRLRIRTNDPRHPQVQVPVTLTVPAFQHAVNVGGSAYIDTVGDLWDADRRYSPGKWGFVGHSDIALTQRSIAHTDDDRLYQELREGFFEYRFDGLTSGRYQVDLRFAEIEARSSAKRRFSLQIERQLPTAAPDIVSEVGRFAATDRTFYTTVSDGQLNIRFIPRWRFGQPIVNAIRITRVER